MALFSLLHIFVTVNEVLKSKLESSVYEPNTKVHTCFTTEYIILYSYPTLTKRCTDTITQTARADLELSGQLAVRKMSKYIRPK